MDASFEVILGIIILIVILSLISLIRNSILMGIEKVLSKITRR